MGGGGVVASLKCRKRHRTQLKLGGQLIQAESGENKGDFPQTL